MNLAQQKKANTDVTFPLECPTMRLIALAHLLSVVGAEEEGSPQNGPIDDGLAARLKTLSGTDLLLLAKHTRPMAVQLHISQSTLQSDLNRCEHIKHDEDLFRYFLLNGAPTSLVTELFNKSVAQVKQKQASLKVAPPPGRTPMPGDDARLDIIAAWEQLCSSVPYKRERYHALHQRFPVYTLAQLDAVIQTWQAQQRRVKSSTHRLLTAQA